MSDHGSLSKPPHASMAIGRIGTVAHDIDGALDGLRAHAGRARARATALRGALGRQTRTFVQSLRALLRRIRARADDSGRAARRALARQTAVRRARRRRALEQRLAHEADERVGLMYAPRLRELELALASLRDEHAQLQRLAHSLTAEDEALPAADLVAKLRRVFPRDRVDAQRRGPTTVDVVHAVRAGPGAPVSLVLYRLSEEGVWRGAHVRGAKRAAARQGAIVAVVVSPVLPERHRHLVVRDGVTVVRPSLVVPLAASIRHGMVAAHQAARARERTTARERQRAAIRAAFQAMSAWSRGVVRRARRRSASLVHAAAHFVAARQRPRPVATVIATVVEPPPTQGVRQTSDMTVSPAAPELTAALETRLADATGARERALLRLEMAEVRIHQADPGSSVVVVDAAAALIGQKLPLAASDLLLERIAAGPNDRRAQLLLLQLEQEMGLQPVAADRGHLLAEVLRLDGCADEAARIEELVRG